MLTSEQIQSINERTGIKPAANVNRASKLRQVWGMPEEIKSVRYDVPMPELSKEDKLRRAESSAAEGQAELKQATSFGGFTKNFGSALLGNIAPSEVGLGKTITKIAGAGSKPQLDAINSLSETRAKVQQAIKEGKAAGQDTSRLEIQFNRTSDLIDQYMSQIEEAGKLPSTKEVVGQLGGTALDILSAGTYGKSTGTLAGMRTGSLAPRASTLPTTLQLLRETASKPSGLFTARGLGRVAEGGLIGYGYDITGGLREGEKDPFTPGIGTAIGAGLPGLGAAGTTIKSVSSPLLKGGKILFGKIDDSMRTTETKNLETAWSSFFDSKKSTRKKIATEISQGKDPAKELAEGGYIPKVINDKLNTEDIVAKQTEQISERMTAVDEYVNQFPDKNIKLSNIQESARQSLIDDPKVGPDLQKSLNELNSFFDSYRMKYGDDIDLATVNQIRKDMNAKTKSYKTDAYVLDTADAVGKSARETIDTVTNNQIVREVNAEIGRIGSARKMAALIDGDAVKFGKVSRWAARFIGAMIGSASSKTPIGPILGSIGGDAIVSVLQSLTFTNPLRTRILQSISRDEPILQKIADETSEAARNYLNKQLEQLRLPRLPAPNYIPTQEFKGGVGGPLKSAESLNKAPESQSLRRNESTINQNANVDNKPTIIDTNIPPSNTNSKGQTNPATLLGGAALSGATIAANTTNKEVINNPAVDNKEITAGKSIKSLLDSIAFVETNTVKGDKYSYRKPSGNKELGDDLGKYQVTEGELKDYAKLLLGRRITTEEFLASGDIQEEYMNAKVRFLLDEGLSPEEVVALHAQGMTGWGNKEVVARKIGDANKNRSNYVINAMNVYNKNK